MCINIGFFTLYVGSAKWFFGPTHPLPSDSEWWYILVSMRENVKSEGEEIGERDLLAQPENLWKVLISWRCTRLNSFRRWRNGLKNNQTKTDWSILQKFFQKKQWCMYAYLSMWELVRPRHKYTIIIIQGCQIFLGTTYQNGEKYTK
jgi:hypothetical protein